MSMRATPPRCFPVWISDSRRLCDRRAARIPDEKSVAIGAMSVASWAQQPAAIAHQIQVLTWQAAEPLGAGPRCIEVLSHVDDLRRL